MNCIKCDTFIPEGKLFCPNCGHFNEPTTPKLTDQFKSSLIVNKIMPILGGILVAFSFFLTWVSYKNIYYVSGFTYVYKSLLMGGVITEAEFYQMPTMAIVSFFFSFIFFGVGGWLIPFCGITTAFLSFKMNKNAFVISIITLIVPILQILVFLIYIKSPVRATPNEMRSILLSLISEGDFLNFNHLDVGIVILFLGLACIACSLLIQSLNKKGS